jgi:hypothetical protein
MLRQVKNQAVPRKLTLMSTARAAISKFSDDRCSMMGASIGFSSMMMWLYSLPSFSFSVRKLPHPSEMRHRQRAKSFLTFRRRRRVQVDKFPAAAISVMLYAASFF